MMQMESPDLPVGMPGIHAAFSRAAGNGRLDNLFHRGGKEPYAHIWELVGCLPRRKAVVDDLLRRFVDELNIVYDAVHEDTFQASYDAFWNRTWADDDLTAVDLRWLSLLFIILAFAVLADCPLDASVETQRASEETSVQFFWASRKAIVLAPTISGESPDLVRAGILVSRYLLYFGRKTESWLTTSFAIRMAQAQGMHVDGESWGLPPKVLETRRRLWCILYSLDRSVSLAIGRPYAINRKHCMLMRIRNVWLDGMTNEEAAAAVEKPADEPTRTIYYTYQQQLSTILGDIHDDCFGIAPMTASYNTYEKVLALDRVLLSWADALPPYFRLDHPDKSMDADRPYLYWQRMYLHSSYHFARITLHRTYVVLESITDRFQYSRDACIASACADLRLKLNFRPATMADRLKAGGAMHNLFNSALVLGIIVVRDPHAAKTGAILEDLAAYCEKQRADVWVNEFALAEVKVIELCVSSARRLSREGRPQQADRRSARPAALHALSTPYAGLPPNDMSVHTGLGGYNIRPQTYAPDTDQDDAASSAVGPYEMWLDSWFGPTRNFPEPMEFQFWEDLVGILEARE
jgi:hypothetical protein